MPWMGLLLGALIGAYLDGFRGFIAGGAVGFVSGLVLRKSSLAGEPASSRRILALEQRVAALEAALARSGTAPPAVTAGRRGPGPNAGPGGRAGFGGGGCSAPPVPAVGEVGAARSCADGRVG